MIKMLLMDLDGTALMADQVNISTRNMAALRAALDKGVTVVPCTGRVIDMFPPVFETEPRIRYLISSHGARLYDSREKRSLYTDILTPEDSATVLRVFENQGIYSEVAAQGTIFAEKAVARNLAEHAVPSHHMWYMADEHRHTAVDCMSEYFLEHGIGIEKVNIYGLEGAAKKRVYDQLAATGLIGFTRPGLEVDIEFASATLDKLKSVETLCELLGIGWHEIMAIGDSASDEAIIEKSAVGVAMGNAPDWLKQKADDVTRRSEEDGVAAAIEKHILRA